MHEAKELTREYVSLVLCHERDGSGGVTVRRVGGKARPRSARALAYMLAKKIHAANRPAVEAKLRGEAAQAEEKFNRGRTDQRRPRQPRRP